MSGPPLLRSMDITEPENKEPPPQKQVMIKKNGSKKSARGVTAVSVLRQKSMNGSCSSDMSSSSSSSGGRMVVAVAARRREVSGRKQCDVGGADSCSPAVPMEDKVDCVQRKRCGWVTPNSDPCYITFHDEEWGVPVHDDMKLFELLSLSGALAELAWPVILTKRQIFRDVFLDFDPVAVSKLNEKKVVLPGTSGISLLPEQKLRSIIENARQMLKVIDEFGSFDKYIWNFVNHKATINQFRYSRQVLVKTSKAELISKDLVRRGFRSVGPSVIYAFMQAAGLTNDHLVSCFRFQKCLTTSEAREKDEALCLILKKKEPEDTLHVRLSSVWSTRYMSHVLYKRISSWILVHSSVQYH